ncbi:MAG: hypothetical protein J6J44_05765 [Lachnospiraceae bacterium]|nr:hypothetical protein [Lachnospiraceae bacterium]
MQERLKELPKKFLEYWNKWTSKQKTIIIAVLVGIIVLIAVLVAILGRTKYVALDTFEDTKTASQVVSLLKESTIETKLAADNQTVMVDEKRYGDAIMAVAVSDLVQEDVVSLTDLLTNSLTTTNGERLQKDFLFNTGKLEKMIRETNDGVDDIAITYRAKDTSNSIINANREIPAHVYLVTNEFFDKKEAVAIAEAVAFTLGNTNTDAVRVTNQEGKVLFNGAEEENSDEIDLTDKIKVEEIYRQNYIDMVTGVMSMNLFTEINVAPYLDMNFDKASNLLTEYIPLDGETTGVLIEEHHTKSEGENGLGDIPGTDSNDEVDYYITDTTGGAYSSKTDDMFYQPSVSITETVYDTGTINAATSSIAVTAIRTIHMSEEEMIIRGLLDDMTYEEYVALNSEKIRTETPEELITLISKATGIPEENVALVTYDDYNYTPMEEVARDWTFYFQILLAVILIAFLLFVVFRGMAPVEVTELEPELSVEQLLATTKENQSLEDVEFSEQSETRKMIEKFFEENPEAVAQLLRNWLNEDWDY